MKHLIPLFSALLLTILIIGGYLFLLSNISTDASRVAIALGDAQTLSVRDAQARSADVLLQDTEMLRNSLQSVVVNDDDVVSVIELLERVAKEEGVTLSISSVSIASVGEWQHHERIDALFSVEGTFNDVTDFVSTLEAFPFALRLENGTLEASRNGTWFGAFMFTFVKEKL